MKEYGGYIELDTYNNRMLHEDMVPLNCGRNCLAWLIEARNIKKILLPRFLCASVFHLCEKYGLNIRTYCIDESFLPQNVFPKKDEWLYVVNYYGQLKKEQVEILKSLTVNLIIDNAQAYFQEPLQGIDTIYTCRKYFGVPDGAFLYTDATLQKTFDRDESFRRMNYLLGRFERTASEFYQEYVNNNHIFANEPIKKMSRLTMNLLKAIDYERIKKQREKNFEYLHSFLGSLNQLNLTIPAGPFMYPFLCENGKAIRNLLKQEKIYIPILWPDVFAICDSQDPEYRMAEDILPLPVDQRYSETDMKHLYNRLIQAINNI